MRYTWLQGSRGDMKGCVRDIWAVEPARGEEQCGVQVWSAGISAVRLHQNA